jgi:hypothetical protein
MPLLLVLLLELHLAVLVTEAFQLSTSTWKSTQLSGPPLAPAAAAA